MEMITERPQINSYSDPVDYLRDMIQFRKKSEASFSIYQAAKPLRKVSPSLVSLLLKKKRRITVDRSEELAKLLGLTAAEKSIFKSWIEGGENHSEKQPISSPQHKNRKEVTTHILNDWINVFVKDFFQFSQVQKDPKLIYQYLAPVATPSRIDKAIRFLLREGHLRTSPDGRLVIEANLVVADPQLPNKKIRTFHKAALNMAKIAIDLYATEERLANTLILPLDDDRYQDLLKLIEDFAEKLKNFAAEGHQESNGSNNQVGNTNNGDHPNGDQLYQLIVNLSPIGGKIK